MNSILQKKMLEHCNQVFDELYTINSLINMIKTSCEEKEFKSKYYNVSLETAKKLSKERNEYINILYILSEKVEYLISQHLLIEKDLTYIKTPTIAADR